ncbi:hypothetical protein GUJ93_ZPchr0018g11331 [Zizania palustris]|uniref:Uncharacterized protein n=1 Tax=Zizania palustris TaxID=103762 RepID=A0A8J5SUC5_ZIZPA|nr:hypothetical protein GUJ93_ZPchr0018g11331 [Zizania palustris]
MLPLIRDDPKADGTDGHRAAAYVPTHKERRRPPPQGVHPLQPLERTTAAVGERSHRNELPPSWGAQPSERATVAEGRACMVVGMGRRRRRGERSRQNEPPPPELDNTGKGPQRLLLRSKMNLVVTCYLHESRKVVPSTTGGEIWSGDLWVPSGRCCLSATARSGICAPHGDDDLFQQLRSPRRRRPVPTATFPTAAVVRSSGGGDAPCELGKLSYVAAWAS